MNTIERQLTGATAYRIDEEDNDSEDLTVRGGSDSQQTQQPNGIIKKMDFEVTYEVPGELNSSRRPARE